MTTPPSSESLRPSAKAGCLAVLSIPAAFAAMVYAVFALEGTVRLAVVGGSVLIVLLALWWLRRSFRRIQQWSERKDEEFWEWFAAHEAEYRDLSSNDMGGQIEAMQVIGAAVAEVDSRLKCQVHYPGDGKPELVLTADGDSWMFDVVDRLIAKMPPQKHWNIIALKPRHPYTTDMKMMIAGLELSPANFTYSFGEPDEEGKLPVILYTEGVDPSNEQLLGGYHMFANVTLQFLLGEREMGEGLGGIEVKPSSEAPEGGHWPLAVIAEHFDSTRAYYRQKAEAEQAGEA